MSSSTCSSEFCNQGWAEVLTHMSPYGFANFGVAFGLGLSVIGAAWGIWLTGSSRKFLYFVWWQSPFLVMICPSQPENLDLAQLVNPFLLLLLCVRVCCGRLFVCMILNNNNNCIFLHYRTPMTNELKIW